MGWSSSLGGMDDVMQTAFFIGSQLIRCIINLYDYTDYKYILILSQIHCFVSPVSKWCIVESYLHTL